MIDLTLHIFFFLLGAAIMLFLLGLGIAVIMPGIDRWSKRFFIVFFSILFLYCIATLAEEMIVLHPPLTSDLLLVEKGLYYLESLFCSILMPMLTAYLLHCCKIDYKRSSFFRAAAILWLVFFVLLNIIPFSELFYYITPENEFVRGPFYSAGISILAALLVLNVAGVIHWKDRMSRLRFFAFLIGFLPMTVAVFIHLFVSIFTFLGIGIMICALSMFGIILYDQLEQYLHQQQEIALQRTRIMVLQMRPHFIYNTMMSIYYLCKQDPDLAQQITLDFTTYLRKNFTAVTSENAIPFSEELEHTRAYLAVEQAQFEDRLFVDYDTPHTDFKIPPLTLQPIVENAVKHGMDPDSEPLRISIRTKKTRSGSEIIVEDNGPGFDPSKISDSNSALSNIRQRLDIMCRGEMEILSEKGSGTVVIVKIPS